MEGNKARADNCRRADTYRGAGELHLDMGARRDNHRGEGRSSWHYYLAVVAYQRKQAWLEQAICLS